MRQEISKPKTCPTCGYITYQGEVKYTCDGCGRDLTGMWEERLEVSAQPKDTSVTFLFFHFCDWHCLRRFWLRKKDLLKTCDTIYLPCLTPKSIDEIFKGEDEEE